MAFIYIFYSIQKNIRFGVAGNGNGFFFTFLEIHSLLCCNGKSFVDQTTNRTIRSLRSNHTIIPSNKALDATHLFHFNLLSNNIIIMDESYKQFLYVSDKENERKIDQLWFSRTIVVVPSGYFLIFVLKFKEFWEPHWFTLNKRQTFNKSIRWVRVHLWD